MCLLFCSILKPVLVESVASSSKYYFLRRLVTTLHLPPSLRDRVEPRGGTTTIHLLIPPPLPINADDIGAVLRPCIEGENLPVIRTTHIPVGPPTTAEQAALWSKDYWPCTFNPASQPIQKAPPLRILRMIQDDLDSLGQLKSYFDLAKVTAAECGNGGFGRHIAAVVVDPAKQEVIAVAGDARWFEPFSNSVTRNGHDDGLAEGRPEHHALMRAIAMVADKEESRKGGRESPSTTAVERQATDLGERAMTATEQLYAATNTERRAFCEQFPGMPPAQSSERPDAYLCNGLHVYLTHEPCVACSMAMIHSRFRACVFIEKMPRTGGLCAEKENDGLGYGLFWRRELNWRVLTFQYLPSDEGTIKRGKTASSGAEEHVEADFHA